MAAADLARGRAIAVNPIPDEIIMFLLSKEFGWLPSQIENESYRNIKAYIHMLSVYNRAKNAETESLSKKSYGQKPNKFGSGRYVVQERIGPNGIEKTTIPM